MEGIQSTKGLNAYKETSDCHVTKIIVTVQKHKNINGNTKITLPDDGIRIPHDDLTQNNSNCTI